MIRQHLLERGHIFYTCTFRQPSDMELGLISGQLTSSSKEGQWLHWEQKFTWSSVRPFGECLERGHRFLRFAFVPLLGWGKPCWTLCLWNFVTYWFSMKEFHYYKLSAKIFPGHVYNSLLTISRTFTHIYHAHNTSQFIKPFYYRLSHFLI